MESSLLAAGLSADTIRSSSHQILQLCPPDTDDIAGEPLGGSSDEEEGVVVEGERTKALSGDTTHPRTTSSAMHVSDTAGDMEHTCAVRMEDLPARVPSLGEGSTPVCSSVGSVGDNPARYSFVGVGDSPGRNSSTDSMEVWT